MPIERDHLEDANPLLSVRPGTNAHDLLGVMLAHPDLGFTASELAELSDVPDGSVGKTLARLEDRGLVEAIDGYWVVADDAVAAHVASLRRLEAVAERDAGGFFGRRGDELAGELPDLDGLERLRRSIGRLRRDRGSRRRSRRRSRDSGEDGEG